MTKGSIYLRGNTCWIKYYDGGKAVRESSGSPLQAVAERLLATRLVDLDRGKRTAAKKPTVAALLDQLVADYVLTGRRSVAALRSRIHHIKTWCGKRKATDITTAHCRGYITERLRHGAANATVNRELATLQRAYRLAIRDGVMVSHPYIPLLRENNARQGFFDAGEVDTVLRYLPRHLRSPVEFAYITGWRLRSEVLRLQWRNVDFSECAIRIDGAMTKNGEPRSFPFTERLGVILSEQRDATRMLERANGQIMPTVFHRGGKPITAVRRDWIRACAKAGLPGRIPHDLRRSAVRNMVRAGIPERVAMQLTGHKTRSVFERYNIVGGSDFEDAARRLDDVVRGAANDFPSAGHH
jgi:integrase